MEKLNELRDQYNDLSNECDKTKKRTDQLEYNINSINTEIELREEELKNTSFSVVLKNFDTLLMSFPMHDEKDCSDIKPINVVACERCALIHLKSYIEKEMANFYIM